VSCQAPAERDLSIVVPVYNSAASVHTLLKRLTAVLDRHAESYEIILIDDGSDDRSWDEMRAAHACYGDKLLVVQLMRNYGQHNALMCGLGLARGACVVTMDDDLQNPPEEIPKLIDRLRSQSLDLVYGCPDRRSHAPWRNLGALLVSRFYRTVFKSPLTPTTFRAIRRQLVRSVLFYDLNFTYVDGLLAWCTDRIGSVPVQHHARAQGRSGYSVRRLMLLALNLYTNFSLLPLQAVSLLGLLTAASGFTVGLYYLIQYFAANIAVPGYASIIVAILLLGGVQLLALGVMGEYLGRLHLNVNRKPQYVIRHLEGRAGEPLPRRPTLVRPRNRLPHLARKRA
jgi:undecaprenyl-phosphate 4-deoxy-4-formamido-L-arabinose transferase